MTVENKHKVAKKVWRKWSPHAQAVFNGTYEDILRVGQTCFLHPDTIARKLNPEEFTTVAWNAAWTAACQAQNPGDVTGRVDNVDPRPSGAQVVADGQKKAMTYADSLAG